MGDSRRGVRDQVFMSLIIESIDGGGDVSATLVGVCTWQRTCTAHLGEAGYATLRTCSWLRHGGWLDNEEWG
jgi:hypothetical protein